MARIETYTAQRALQPGSTPQTNYSTAVAEEVQGFGQALAGIGAELKQRQEQREDFAAENAYRRLRLDLDNDLVTQERMPDGSGFHEKFMVDSFRPKRDAFLNALPERLRPRFAALLSDTEGADALEWDIKAATVERDVNYDWQRTEIKATQERLATAISMNPDGYDALLADGEALIAASSLPGPERDKLLRDWETMAQTSILNQLLQDDPHRVLRELGYDARQLSPTTQFAILSRAMQWQESRDNPNAISVKGAVGLMQVMPATAGDIARALGDTAFPHGATDAAITAYISNPYVNKLYGETYLKQQLNRFASARDPIEAALVAYNAGPSVAEKWVESGYDDSILPKETRDYKKNILASIRAPYAKGDPATVEFVGNNGATLEGVNLDLQSRLRDAFASIGLDKIKFNSGFRDPAENARVGGAEKSQHIHGNALDIDVSGMSHSERIELIKALSAAGVTGLGIGANIIHADLGGRRAWGYATSSGGGEVPKWAQGVIAEHLAGTTPPIRQVAGRFGSLPYDKRYAFTTKADQIITQEQAQLQKSAAVEQVQVRQMRDDELLRIRRTGQGSPDFDETAISTVLGEADYLKFVHDRDRALRTFMATDGIAAMPEADMLDRLAMYDPGDAIDETSVAVYDAVHREIDRVRRLRASAPDKGAIEFPDVAEAYTAMAEGVLQNGTYDPQATQRFVRLMIARQREFGTTPEAIKPINSERAVEIGAQLEAAMLLEEGRDRTVALMTFYTNLEQIYGEFADDVVVQAISEYRAIDPLIARQVGNAMKVVAAGRDPFASFRQQVDEAVDIDQGTLDVNRSYYRYMGLPEPYRTLGRAGEAIGSLFGGTPKDTPAEPEADLETLERQRGL